MVAVNKAVMKGQLTVNLPVFFIVMSIMGGACYLSEIELVPPYVMVCGIFLGPLVAWVYWSFAITRWRIWAFSNVDDVHLLKERAIAGQLIWPDGSIFEKTERRTARERKLIAELEKRL